MDESVSSLKLMYEAICDNWKSVTKEDILSFMKKCNEKLDELSIIMPALNAKKTSQVIKSNVLYLKDDLVNMISKMKDILKNKQYIEIRKRALIEYLNQ